MTEQPAVNVGDYVVARHRKYADEIRSVVLGTYRPFPGKMRIEVRADEWSFELAERPQPPLADGVYQKHNSLRFRRDGLWFHPMVSWLEESYQDDAFYRTEGWQYVGPEVSR